MTKNFTYDKIEIKKQTILLGAQKMSHLISNGSTTKGRFKMGAQKMNMEAVKMDLELEMGAIEKLEKRVVRKKAKLEKWVALQISKVAGIEVAQEYSESCLDCHLLLDCHLRNKIGLCFTEGVPGNGSTTKGRFKNV